MSKRTRRIAPAIVVFVLALATVPVLAGSAARTRPSGGGSAARPPSGGASSGAPRGTANGSAPTRASGRATYGYSSGTVVVGPSCGWYGGYPYGWWGWPYGAWGWGWGWGWGSGWPYYGGYYDVATIPIGWNGATVNNIPAWVETEVRPSRATLKLDGEDVGRAKDYRGTWNKLAVAPGAHVIQLESDGYMTLRIAIDAKPGQGYRIDEALQKGSGLDPRSTEIPPAVRTEVRASGTAATASSDDGSGGLRTGRLKLSVTPADAAVYLDGDFLGSGKELAQLHGALPVAAGEHVIDLVRPGYRRKTVRVDVTAGEPTPVLLELGDSDRE